MDRFSLRTPLTNARTSLYGRQSLYNQPNRHSIRPSDAGRLSMIHASGMKKSLPNQIAAKKPPMRNPRDKEHQKQQKEVLKDFFERKENPLEPTCLNMPSAAQFTSIFHFIYAQLDPDYQITNIKEEFPKIMSALGYPLTIKPSTMQTISTAQSWPYLLDALGWLALFVNDIEGIDVMDLISNGEQDVGGRHLAYGYFTSCFKKFKKDNVNTPDDFKPELEILRSQLYESENIVAIEELVKEKASLEQELEELQKECVASECETLEEQITGVQKDVKNLEAYLEQANTYHADVLQKDEGIQNLIEERIAQLESLKQETAARRDQVNRQKIPAHKAREATLQLANIQETLKQARAEEVNLREEPGLLCAQIYKKFSIIREMMSDLGGEINKIAEDFFSPNELANYGFSELGSNRAMDTSAMAMRLKNFAECRQKLLERMDQKIEQCRAKIQANRELENNCQHTAERTNLEIAKLNEEVERRCTNKKLKLEELKQQLNQLERNEEVLIEQKKNVTKKFEKVQNDINVLLKQISNKTIAYNNRKQEIETEDSEMVEQIVDNSTKLFEEHTKIKEIQTTQDASMEALLTQHTALMELIKDIHVEDLTGRRS